VITAEHKPKPPLLALVGPTAAGKSDLALLTAPAIKAEIICADSAQVYRYLDIGTAKPTPKERSLVPHHLFDLVEPDCRFSAAAYQKAAAEVINSVLNRGHLPLLVGGTGLYIKAVTDAYAFGGRGQDQTIRERLQQEADNKGLLTLYRRLADLDPVAATKIHPNDRRRIIRALEFMMLEGSPISGQIHQTQKSDPPFNLMIFGLSMSRADLYRRIDERVESMLRRGFLEEVKTLLKMGYSPDCPGLGILGYRQLAAFVLGEKDWASTVNEIKTQTRQLAKRQLTWFRQDPRIIWLEVDEKDDLKSLAEIICRQVKEKLPLQANNML